MGRKRTRKNTKKTGIAQDGPFPNSLRQDPEQWSFLDLPGEVQNEIHQAVLQQIGGGFLVKGLRIAMPTSLSLVSKQIHAQLLGQAMYAITARVAHFEFANVITFLNRLPEKDIGLLKTKTTTSGELERKPKLKIELKVSAFNLSTSDLLRWLNRFSVPTKRAAGLEIEYVWLSGNLPWLKDFYEDREQYISHLTANEAGKMEMRRMLRGVLQAWRRAHRALAERLANVELKCKCGKADRHARFFHPIVDHWSRMCDHCRLKHTSPPEEHSEQAKQSTS